MTDKVLTIKGATDGGAIIEVHYEELDHNGKSERYVYKSVKEAAAAVPKLMAGKDPEPVEPDDDEVKKELHKPNIGSTMSEVKAKE